MKLRGAAKNPDKRIHFDIIPVLIRDQLTEDIIFAHVECETMSGNCAPQG